MNFTEFRKAASVTESRFDLTNKDPALIFSILNVAFFAGEIADLLKKNVAYGRDIDQGKFEHAANALIENLTIAFESLQDPEEPSQEAIEARDRLNSRLLHGILGKVTEDAELVEALLKVGFDGEQLDIVNLKEELGDGRWYDAIIYNTLEELGDEANEEKVQAAIIAKLKVRYADKFSSAEANERNLADERAVLEASV